MTASPTILTASESNIDRAVEALSKGEVLFAPTETSYMLACDAELPEACEKIYRLKGRDPKKPLPTIVGSDAIAKKYVKFSRAAEALGKAFWPGPLTLVLPRKKKALPAFYPEQEALAMRVTSHDWVREVAQRLGHPIVSTSANLSGNAPSFSVSQFLEQSPESREAVALFFDDGTLPMRPASTILKVVGDEWEVLRPGPILTADIVNALKES